MQRSFPEYLEKFPNYRHELNDLKHDIDFHQNEAKRKIQVFLLPTWGFLTYRAVTTGPLPIFRSHGRIFGTGRNFRHFLYSFLGIYTFFGLPLKRRIERTEKVLDDYLEREQKENNGIRLDLPFNSTGIYYSDGDTEFNN